MQALEGLNRLTKGLNLQLCTVKRPAVGEQLAVPLQAALSISRVPPRPSDVCIAWFSAQHAANIR